MRCALVLNLLGTAMLFFSFQATSSNIRVIRSPNNRTALCIDQVALFAAEGRGWAIGVGCPTWPNARAVAVVNIEHPRLVTLGFIILSLGFLLQFLSIPSPKTIAQMRKELKASVKKEKLRSKMSDTSN
jgi:hypothetical protein